MSATSEVLSAQKSVVVASGLLMKEVSHSSDTVDDLQGAKDTMGMSHSCVNGLFETMYHVVMIVNLTKASYSVES